MNRLSPLYKLFQILLCMINPWFNHLSDMITAGLRGLLYISTPKTMDTGGFSMMKADLVSSMPLPRVLCAHKWVVHRAYSCGWYFYGEDSFPLADAVSSMGNGGGLCWDQERLLFWWWKKYVCERKASKSEIKHLFEAYFMIMYPNCKIYRLRLITSVK